MEEGYDMDVNTAGFKILKNKEGNKVNTFV